MLTRCKNHFDKTWYGDLNKCTVWCSCGVTVAADCADLGLSINFEPDRASFWKLVSVPLYNTFLKPCPHCCRKVRLSQKTARQRRQSPNSSTVALFCDSGQAFTRHAVLMGVELATSRNLCVTRPRPNAYATEPHTLSPNRLLTIFISPEMVASKSKRSDN